MPSGSGEPTILESGEIVGILGPNGSGKTTTICCILGLLKRDSGSVILNGVVNGPVSGVIGSKYKNGKKLGVVYGIIFCAVLGLVIGIGIKDGILPEISPLFIIILSV